MKLLQEEIIRKGLDCALFVTYEKVNPNLFYLTGYVGSGVLIVRKDEKPILHVSTRDFVQAKQINGVEVTSGKKLTEILIEKGIDYKKIGIDFANIYVLDFNLLREKLNCEFVDLSDFMNSLRVVKSKEEVEKIQKACKITDLILSNFVKNFKKFKTEEDAAAFLVYEARKQADGVSFEPIVASGVNAAVPHHTPYGKLQKGFCVVDFGVKYSGYCSDVTRTFYVGKPTKEEEKVYYDLLNAQEKAIGLVKPGIAISDLCNKVEKNLKQKLIHSLGHGLGIEVHEMPYVSTNSKDVLKEGMVITIEPGEYIEGKYGIRIEDDVLVTNSGQKMLSKFSKKLICL